MLNIIVFSKDRACQLELFLRTMDLFCDNSWRPNVLYTASSPEYEYGYEQLIAMPNHTNAVFHRQQDFKKDLLRITNEHSSHTVFFVDDMVWVDFLPYSLWIDGGDVLRTVGSDFRLCYSLRLHEDITYSYPSDRLCYISGLFRLPKYNYFRWTKSGGCFGYPMSLDGHIFRTEDIFPLLRHLEYNNPNTLEVLMACHPLVKKPFMMMGHKNTVINLPLNKVQAAWESRNMGIDALSLNSRFLDGEIIDHVPFIGTRASSCHVEMPVTFIKSSTFYG